MLDAAVAHRQRQANISRDTSAVHQQADIVLVRNDSGSPRQQFDILGIDGPIISPDANETEFRSRVALKGVTPGESHIGRFVVLAEPLANGKIGKAFVAGACPVKLNVDDDKEWRYAEIADGVTANLKVSMQGSAGILWRAGGTGVQWAVVRLGKAIPMHVFPVELTQVGGAQGDEANPATWTYDVLDVVTGEELESGVDPVAAPHKWQRPSVGQMIAATFGYAHYQDDGSGGYDLVLGWINEMVDQEACDD